MEATFPQLKERSSQILKEMTMEESRFLLTLERGEKLLADILKRRPDKITGE